MTVYVCEFSRLSPRLDPRWLVVVIICWLRHGNLAVSPPAVCIVDCLQELCLQVIKFTVRKGKARQNRVDREARHIAAQYLFINHEERRKKQGPTACLWALVTITI